MSGRPESQPLDYDGLMQANLARVFGEHDAENRLEAIRELYAEDAVLNEPHASAKGHAAINAVVSSLLAGLPPGFVFRSIGPAVVTGMDIAHFAGNRIHSLFVFLEPDDT